MKKDSGKKFNWKTILLWVFWPIGLIRLALKISRFNQDLVTGKLGEKEKARKDEAARIARKKKNEERRKEEQLAQFDRRFKALDQLQIEISTLEQVESIEVDDFKRFVHENESELTQKGGDKVLFDFL